MSEVHLIPAPVRLLRHDGLFDTRNAAVRPGGPFAAEAALLAAQLQLPLRDGGEIVLSDDWSSAPPESLRLRIGTAGIRIGAVDPAGAFRATQILRQLRLDGPLLPCVEIEDAPRFPWRGLMLDCCRHFMDLDDVKATIDRIAVHGLNRFHWHLTEDQGWRLEIPSRPRLTTVGAVRAGGHGGFYTADQVREVVAFAAARHVTVVPEIEMPGHCRAALAAYPELSCRRLPLPVETEWGIFEDVYCAGDEAVFEFLFEVLEETLALFPSPWIHIGGDEAPRDRWRECPRCLERVRAERLDGVDGLQSWFLRRVEAWLSARGRTLVGWDEILEGGLPPRAVVQSWRGFAGAEAAARAGHATIVSPTSHAYFDYGLDRIDLERVFDFEPVPAGVDPALVLGGEANMWTERAPREVVDARIWPRLLAMAERLWVPRDRRDFDAFRTRVRHHYPRLDALGVAYGEETA